MENSGNEEAAASEPLNDDSHDDYFDHMGMHEQNQRIICHSEGTYFHSNIYFN